MARRLSPERADDALWSFAVYMYPDEDYPEGFADGLGILYRDDEDGRSYYQVMDAQGHRSDGWMEVD
jgi:hypothetical protein